MAHGTFFQSDACGKTYQLVAASAKLVMSKPAMFNYQKRIAAHTSLLI
jgi:hypothetical protein